MAFFRLKPLLPVAIFLSIPLGSLTAQAQPYEGCYFINPAGAIVNLNELCRTSAPGDLAPPQEPLSNENESENSPASECEQLLTIINEGVNNTSNLTNTDDPEALLTSADGLDRTVRQIAGVTSSDSTLEVYRAQFIQMYQQIGQAIREFVRADREEDPSTAASALTALQATTAPEAQLVEDINQYCS
ncbi:hypothetical protein IQ249_09460 [Lusitaniella coriacea LEGE 07157]|uniref:Secreted protein n=1 Tax=Lusitaniella coriacea LEGE 07157 TaxID=945747 RepID=A0A8J7DVY6_9CYAN|nr:hypothetical protein [Lusitaniella coriacea]MBE9116121.1 hypothetical protein [Lusitaniella coriacea LEGE 07157]